MEQCQRCFELEQKLANIEKQQKNERETTLAVMRCAFGFIKDRRDQIEDLLLRQNEVTL